MAAVQSKLEQVHTCLRLLTARDQLPFAVPEAMQSVVSSLWEQLEAVLSAHGADVQRALDGRQGMGDQNMA